METCSFSDSETELLFNLTTLRGEKSEAREEMPATSTEPFHQQQPLVLEDEILLAGLI